MADKVTYRKGTEDIQCLREMRMELEKNISLISPSRIFYARVRGVLFPMIYVALYISSLVFSNDHFWFFLCYSLMGIMIVLLFLNLFHEAAHGTLYKGKWRNDLMLLFFDLVGANSFVWKKRHKMHHNFTNIDGWDADVEQAGLLRIFPHSELKWHHRFQSVFVFSLYPLFLLNWVLVRDFKDYFGKNRAIKKMLEIPVSEYIKMVAFKLFFISYITIIPSIWMVPVSVALSGLLLMSVAAGTLSMVILLTPHVNTKNSFPMPDNAANMKNSWLRHQFETTNDLIESNWLTRNVLANFNFHLAHHVFPGISSVYAPEATKILRAFAPKYGLTYRAYSITDAFKYHYSLIKQNAVSTAFFEDDM